MIKVANIYPDNWRKKMYIASKLEVKYDDENNEIMEYLEPTLYHFNYQPVSSAAEIAEFGEKVSEMLKMVIPISFKDKFKEFDIAYIDVEPTGESIYGTKANYRLLPPRNGNAVITIYLQKITGK